MRWLSKAELHFAKALDLIEAIGLPEADEVRQNLEKVRDKLSRAEYQADQP